MQMKFDFYADTGHGWLKVKTKDLIKLNIAQRITSCSYLSATGEYAFLEEDCDFATFVVAWQTYTGEKWRFTDDHVRYHHGNKSSKIRNYQPYVIELRGGIV